MIKDTRHLKVTNVPDGTDLHKIKACFADNVGKVQRVEWCRGVDGSRDGGFVVVSFRDIRSAVKALGAHLQFGGRPLKVDFYEQGRSKSPLEVQIHDSCAALLAKERKKGFVIKPASFNRATYRHENIARTRDTERTGPGPAPPLPGPGPPRSSARAPLPSRSHESGSSRHSSGSSSRSRSHSGSSHARSGLGAPPPSGDLRSRSGKRETSGQPPTSNVVLIRNLPSRSTDQSIKDGLYHKYKKLGKVASVKVVGESDARYALVSFRTPADAQNIFELSQIDESLFLGCKILVEIAPAGFEMADDNEKRPLVKDFDEHHPNSSRTLYIGNLENRHGLSPEMLREMFSPFGDILDVDIKNQNTPAPFAFIQFTDIRSVVQAIHKMDSEFMGHNKLKLGFGKSLPSSVVWLDDLLDYVNEAHLCRKLSFYGTVQDTVNDPVARQALVYFESAEVAQKCVQDMKGRTISGRRVQVDFASRELQDVFLDRLEQRNLRGEKGYVGDLPPGGSLDLIDPYYNIDRLEKDLYERERMLKEYERRSERRSSLDAHGREPPLDYAEYRDKDFDSYSRRGDTSRERYPPDHQQQQRRRSMSPGVRGQSRGRSRDVAAGGGPWTPQRAPRDSRDRRFSNSRQSTSRSPMSKRLRLEDGSPGRMRSPDADAEGESGRAMDGPGKADADLIARRFVPLPMTEIIPDGPSAPLDFSDQPLNAGKSTASSKRTSSSGSDSSSSGSSSGDSSSGDSSDSSGDEDAANDGIDRSMPELLREKQQLLQMLEQLDDEETAGKGMELLLGRTAAAAAANAAAGGTPGKPAPKLQDVFDLRWQRQRLRALAKDTEGAAMALGLVSSDGTTPAQNVFSPAVSAALQQAVASLKNSPQLSGSMLSSIASAALAKAEDRQPILEPARSSADEDESGRPPPPAKVDKIKSPVAPKPVPPPDMTGLFGASGKSMMDSSLGRKSLADETAVGRASYAAAQRNSAAAFTAAAEADTDAADTSKNSSADLDAAAANSSETEFRKRRRPAIKMVGGIRSEAGMLGAAARYEDFEQEDESGIVVVNCVTPNQVGGPRQDADAGKTNDDGAKSASNVASSGDKSSVSKTPHAQQVHGTKPKSKHVVKSIPLEPPGEHTGEETDPRRPRSNDGDAAADEEPPTLDLPLPKFAAALQGSGCTRKCRSPGELNRRGGSDCNSGEEPRRPSDLKIDTGDTNHASGPGGGSSTSAPHSSARNSPLTSPATALLHHHFSSSDVDLSPGPETTPGANSDPFQSPLGLGGGGSPPSGSPGRPSLEERIKALDEKFNVLEKAVKAVNKSTMGSTSFETSVTNKISALTTTVTSATNSLVTVSSTAATHQVDYTKYTIKKRSYVPSSFTPMSAAATLPFSSSMTAKTILKSTIFDQDIQRLAGIEAKYTPGVYQAPNAAPAAPEDDTTLVSPSPAAAPINSVNSAAPPDGVDTMPGLLSVRIPSSDLGPLPTPITGDSECGFQSSGFQPKRPMAPPPRTPHRLSGDDFPPMESGPCVLATSPGFHTLNHTGMPPGAPMAVVQPIPISPPPLQGILKKGASSKSGDTHHDDPSSGCNGPALQPISPQIPSTPVDPRMAARKELSPPIKSPTPTNLASSRPQMPYDMVKPDTIKSLKYPPAPSSSQSGPASRTAVPSVSSHPPRNSGVARQASVPGQFSTGAPSDERDGSRREEKTFGLRHEKSNAQLQRSASTSIAPTVPTAAAAKVDAALKNKDLEELFKTDQDKSSLGDNRKESGLTNSLPKIKKHKPNDFKKDVTASVEKRSEKVKGHSTAKKDEVLSDFAPKPPKTGDSNNKLSRKEETGSKKTPDGAKAKFGDKDKDKDKNDRKRVEKQNSSTSLKPDKHEDKQKSGEKVRKQDKKKVDRRRKVSKESKRGGSSSESASSNESEGDSDDEKRKAKSALSKEWQEVLAVLEDEPLPGLSMYDRVKRRSSAMRTDGSEKPPKEGGIKEKFSKLKDSRRDPAKPKRRRVQVDTTSSEDEDHGGDASDKEEKMAREDSKERIPPASSALSETQASISGHSSDEAASNDEGKQRKKISKGKKRVEDVFSSDSDDAKPEPKPAKERVKKISEKPSSDMEAKTTKFVTENASSDAKVTTANTKATSGDTKVTVADVKSDALKQRNASTLESSPKKPLLHETKKAKKTSPNADTETSELKSHEVGKKSASEKRKPLSDSESGKEEKPGDEGEDDVTTHGKRKIKRTKGALHSRRRRRQRSSENDTAPAGGSGKTKRKRQEGDSGGVAESKSSDDAHPISAAAVDLAPEPPPRLLTKGAMKASLEETMAGRRGNKRHGESAEAGESISSTSDGLESPKMHPANRPIEAAGSKSESDPTPQLSIPTIDNEVVSRDIFEALKRSAAEEMAMECAVVPDEIPIEVSVVEEVVVSGDIDENMIELDSGAVIEEAEAEVEGKKEEVLDIPPEADVTLDTTGVALEVESVVVAAIPEDGVKVQEDERKEDTVPAVAPKPERAPAVEPEPEMEETVMPSSPAVKNEPEEDETSKEVISSQNESQIEEEVNTGFIETTSRDTGYRPEPEQNAVVEQEAPANEMTSVLEEAQTQPGVEPMPILPVEQPMHPPLHRNSEDTIEETIATVTRGDATTSAPRPPVNLPQPRVASHVDKVIEDVVHGYVEIDPSELIRMSKASTSAEPSTTEKTVSNVVAQLAGLTSSAGDQSGHPECAISRPLPPSSSSSSEKTQPLTGGGRRTPGSAHVIATSAAVVQPVAMVAPTISQGSNYQQHQQQQQQQQQQSQAAVSHEQAQADLLRQLQTSRALQAAAQAAAYSSSGLYDFAGGLSAAPNATSLDPYGSNAYAAAAAAANPSLLRGLTPTPSQPPNPVTSQQHGMVNPSSIYPYLRNQEAAAAAAVLDPQMRTLLWVSNGGYPASSSAGPVAPQPQPAARYPPAEQVGIGSNSGGYSYPSPTEAAHRHAASADAAAQQAFRTIVQKYPIMWQGNLALKNDTALVQMHFVSGNRKLPSESLPQTVDHLQPAILRISQRMRLEPQQLEGVARRMQLPLEHSVLLALPCGRDQLDIYQQSSHLQTAFINYLTQKQAAGIVNVVPGGSSQPSHVIHIFPPCQFAQQNLSETAQDFYQSVQDRQTPYLFVIVATVQ